MALREIKFRGKTKEGTWFYGDLLHAEHDFKEGIDIITEDWTQVTVLQDTVGQYTGLKDANGNEIYEGDIISSDDRPNIKHLIYYDSEEACFRAKYAIGKYDSGRAFQKWIDEFDKQVIGNIHDNPKLV